MCARVGEGQRVRGRESQAGSTLSAQNPLRGLISWTMRSWQEGLVLEKSYKFMKKFKRLRLFTIYQNSVGRRKWSHKAREQAIFLFSFSSPPCSFGTPKAPDDHHHKSKWLPSVTIASGGMTFSESTGSRNGSQASQQGSWSKRIQYSWEHQQKLDETVVLGASV